MKNQFSYTQIYLPYILISFLVALGLIFTALQINNGVYAVDASTEGNNEAAYDEVHLSEIGIDFSDLLSETYDGEVNLPDPVVKIPKGRLGKEDWWGPMSYNIRGGTVSAMSFQTDEGFALTLQDLLGVEKAQAQTTGGGTGSGSSGTGSSGSSNSSLTSQLTSVLGVVSSGSSILEPFGGIALGFPCCNGWYYYHITCGKCDDAGVLDSATHMAWWFSLRKYYLPTLGNPVLGLAIDYESDCYLLIYIPYICNVCECELEAEYTDYVVGTAKDPSKSSQTTQSPSSSGSGTGTGGAGTGGTGSGGGTTVP